MNPAVFPSILLLCREYPHNASTITDHLDALANLPRVQKFLVIDELPPGLDLNRFDALIIHYTLYAAEHLGAKTRRRIREFAGLKVQFIQDEYRTVNRTIDTIRELGIDVLFTCVPPQEIAHVYSSDKLPGVRFVNTLTGFVSEDLAHFEVLDISDRPIDVGYRGRKLPYWLGELGAEKWRIAPLFRDATLHHDLKLDLSWIEEDRIYGTEWVRFLSSCKAVLGVESGASVFDFTGEIQKKVERYMKRHPNAEFEDVQARFFKNQEGKIRLNQISPRCFEAAALRTAMVLYEGEYSGVLEPWRHYIPLKKDFSNIEEVCLALGNNDLLRAMVERTYYEVALNPEYSYKQFTSRCGAVIQEEIAARNKTVGAPGYGAEAFSQFVTAHKERLDWSRKNSAMTLLRPLWRLAPAPVQARVKPLLMPIARRFFPVIK